MKINGLRPLSQINSTNGITMNTIEGFKDRFGVELRRQRFFVDACEAVAESYGYEPISVPILERAEAYDQDIVGLSPWPEWNPKGCFFFSIENYNGSYSEATSITKAVLIPEGTLSVTRWLGAQLDGSYSPALPIRIYYHLNCFRNELISTLNESKGRSFSQFGIEILGASDLSADIEPMVVAHEILRRLGIDKAKIVFRISSNELFLSMAAALSLTHLQRVELKEQLDTIAECKAGKRAERMEVAVNAIWEVINTCSDRTHDSVWTYLIARPVGNVSSDDREILGRYSPNSLNRIEAISNSLNANGVMCEVDYCVVRSHEYYTGITFEIDLIGKAIRHVEVGGGGRYDRLLGNFTPPGGPKSVPCVGFAFGVERLVAALVTEGLLKGVSTRPSVNVDLADDSKIRKLFLSRASKSSLLAEAREYLGTVEALRSERECERIAVNFS